MKAAKAAVLSLVVLLGVALAIDDAFARRNGGGGGGRGHAHHGHGHGHGHAHWRGGVGFGLYLGAPWYYGWPGYYSPYYYPSYYAPAYPAYSPTYASPPVYIEQGQAAAPPAAQQQQGYWYYCRESNAYYPYVNECAGRWEQVAPRPPS